MRFKHHDWFNFLYSITKLFIVVQKQIAVDCSKLISNYNKAIEKSINLKYNSIAKKRKRPKNNYNFECIVFY